MSFYEPLIDRDVLYNARIKLYPNDILKYTVFNKLIYNPDKVELLNKTNKRDDYSKSDDPITRDDSLKRSKDKIFDIAFMNADLWQYMVTLTLDKDKIDRYDKKDINKKLKKWLGHLVERNNVNYLIIPELHKDGAVHFHGLISGNLKLYFSSHYDNNNRPIYNLLNWKYGFSTCVPLDDNKVAVCKYITKYVTKSTTKIFGNIYYCGGHSIKRDVPSVYQNIDYNTFNGNEFDVPNTNIKVKYSILGYLCNQTK